MPLSPGDAFRQRPGHRWVVVAKDDETGSVVAFNFTTHRPGTVGCDSSCVVEPAEYEELPHKSNVYYVAGKLLTPDNQAEIEANPALFPPMKRASRELVQRIQAGALSSKQTANKLREIVQARLDRAAARAAAAAKKG